jgi:hypothetical protein
MMFVIGNPDIYQTNSTLHCINTRQKNKLHVPSVKYYSIQIGVLYSSIKIFNNLPSNIAELQNNKTRFQFVLRKYLAMNAFYWVDEFMSTSHC